MTTIEPREFCQLLICSRSLIRCDDKAAGLRGLVDLDTGESYYVRELDLREFGLALN